MSGRGVAAAAVVAATSCNAADLAGAPGAANAFYQWNGPYIGAHVGGAWDGRSFSQTTTAGPLVERGAIHASSVFGGAQLGYNWAASPLVLLGVEADGSAAGLSGTARTFNLLGIGPEWRQEIDAFGTVRGRAGLVWQNWLFYGTGGLALADDRFTRTQITANAGSPPAGLVVSNNGTRAGWAAGAGLERGFTPHWSAKVEYMHMDFGTASFRFTVAPGTFSVQERTLAQDSVKVGVNYHFD